jgi:copper/silver efflux system protein
LAKEIRVATGIQGADLNRIREIARDAEQILNNVPGTRSVFAERTGNGYFLDEVWNREALAQYGLSIEDAQNALSTAVGGANVSSMFEGRERYPVSVRYLRDFRSDLDSLGKVLVAALVKSRSLSPQWLSIRTLNGPAMIRDENGLRTGYIFVDVAGVLLRRLHRRSKAPTRESAATSRGLRTRLERAV